MFAWRLISFSVWEGGFSSSSCKICTSDYKNTLGVCCNTVGCFVCLHANMLTLQLGSGYCVHYAASWKSDRIRVLKHLKGGDLCSQFFQLYVYIFLTLNYNSLARLSLSQGQLLHVFLPVFLSSFHCPVKIWALNKYILKM